MNRRFCFFVAMRNLICYNACKGGEELEYKIPYPKRYWVYLKVIAFCAIMIFLNIFRTDVWTGNLEFSVYTQRQWLQFVIFIAEEVLLLAVMIAFTALFVRLCKKRNAMITALWRKERILSTIPGGFDYVWIDFSVERRALIRKIDKWFYVSVQAYDPHTGNWNNERGESGHESLDAIGKMLFYEAHFQCEENTKIDNRGHVSCKH